MSNVKPDLRKCSRCHSTCSLEHFEINRKGELYKLCNTCRVKKKPILSEEQCINNNSSLLEVYRDEYEDFMETSTKDLSHRFFSEEEQIMRYSKHLAFWFMKLDAVKHIENEKKCIEPFIKDQIVTTMLKMRTMFPQEVIFQINKLSNNARQIHENLRFEFLRV